MAGRVNYAYAGVTHRRFITAVTRANLGKAAERVAMAITCLLSSYSKTEDQVTLSQITELAYPCALEGDDTYERNAFKNATRQTSRGLSDLSRAGLITYKHATGTSPMAWVSITQHAPPDSDPALPYASSGDKPGLLGAPAGVRRGDTVHHPSEKAGKTSIGDQRPRVPMWEPDRSVIPDVKLNTTGIKAARDKLRGNSN